MNASLFNPVNLLPILCERVDLTAMNLNKMIDKPVYLSELSWLVNI